MNSRLSPILLPTPFASAMDIGLDSTGPCFARPPFAAGPSDMDNYAVGGRGGAVSNSLEPEARFWNQRFCDRRDEESYSPHIFLFPPGKILEERGSWLRPEDIHRLICKCLYLICELLKVASSKGQSPLLQPMDFVGHYLIAERARHLQGFYFIKHLTIGSDRIIVTFRDFLNLKKIRGLIDKNPGCIEFHRSEKLVGGCQHEQYSCFNQVIFEVGPNKVILPYAHLTFRHPSQVNFALECFAELITAIHDEDPFIDARQIKLHEYMPIIKDLFGKNLRTKLLGALIAKVAGAADNPSVSALLEKRDRPTSDPDAPEYSVPKEYTPEHVRYVLLRPKKEVVIGFDCYLDFDEIKKRAENSRTGFLRSITTIHEEDFSYPQESEGLRWDANKKEWKQGLAPKRTIKKYSFADERGIIFSATPQSIEIPLDVLSDYERGPRVSAILSEIYDGRLFYTYSIHSYKGLCALTAVEQGVLGAIDDLVRFFETLARPRYLIECARNQKRALSSMEWVHMQFVHSQKRAPKNTALQMLYVLEKIREIGGPYIDILGASNPELRQIFGEMCDRIDALRTGKP